MTAGVTDKLMIEAVRKSLEPFLPPIQDWYCIETKKLFKANQIRAAKAAIKAMEKFNG